MAPTIPNYPPDGHEYWAPPQTAERLDGPGRGNGLRPPTTGTLPPGEQPAPGGPVLLLATEDRRDMAYMKSVLGLGRLLGLPAPTLICCTLDDAPLEVGRLHPALIVVGDRTRWHWGRRHLELCSVLKQSWRVEVPLIVVYTGRRMLGRAALAKASPDAVFSTRTPEHEVAFRLSRLLEARAGRLPR